LPVKGPRRFALNLKPNLNGNISRIEVARKRRKRPERKRFGQITNNTREKLEGVQTVGREAESTWGNAKRIKTPIRPESVSGRHLKRKKKKKGERRCQGGGDRMPYS